MYIFILLLYVEFISESSTIEYTGGKESYEFFSK